MRYIVAVILESIDGMYALDAIFGGDVTERWRRLYDATSGAAVEQLNPVVRSISSSPNTLKRERLGGREKEPGERIAGIVLQSEKTDARRLCAQELV